MDYPDPSNILQLLLKKNHPGINKSVYSNKDFDKLFQEYTQLKSVGNDSPKILELLNEMEQIVLKDLPWIMLYIHRGHIISKGEIKNLRSSTFIRNYIKYLNKK